MRTNSIFDMTPAGVPSEGLTSRKEDAYRRILEIVLGGSLAGGEYLNEQKLAEAFGMSRAPVREALQMLCSQHILDNIPRMGYQVVPITLREILDAIDVRLVLETEGIRLACRNSSEAGRAKLRALLSREAEIQDDEENFHSWIMKGDAVHQTIAEVGGNLILRRTVVSLIDLLRRASIQLILEGKDKPSGIHYHRAIIEAILAGKEEEAVALMRQDILIIKDILVRK
jgi:DNA-binding GntR family transcriptional regulator